MLSLEDLRVLFIEELMKHVYEIPDKITMDSIRNNLVHKIGSNHINVSFNFNDETFYLDFNDTDSARLLRAVVSNEELNKILINQSFAKMQLNNILK